ncbi:DUF4192 family protein [Tessaracoccus coleopterorum]|uniref:DUF4192 family protein n=1 Tax=Tessaracoccus coleopterorum TaxID=2714950 RepID=UPI0038CDBBD3
MSSNSPRSPGFTGSTRTACTHRSDTSHPSRKRTSTTVRTTPAPAGAGRTRPPLNPGDSVLNHTPGSFAAVPAVIAGIAAWVAGDGASANIALTRAQAATTRLRASGPAELLEAVIDQVLPPSAWPSVRGRILEHAGQAVHHALITHIRGARTTTRQPTHSRLRLAARVQRRRTAAHAIGPGRAGCGAPGRHEETHSRTRAHAGHDPDRPAPSPRRWHRGRHHRGPPLLPPEGVGRWRRSSLPQIIDHASSDRTIPVRIEVHEVDQTVFTDIISARPPRQPTPTVETEPEPGPRRGRRALPPQTPRLVEVSGMGSYRAKT